MYHDRQSCQQVRTFPNCHKAHKWPGIEMQGQGIGIYTDVQYPLWRPGDPTVAFLYLGMSVKVDRSSLARQYRAMYVISRIVVHDLDKVILACSV